MIATELQSGEAEVGGSLTIDLAALRWNYAQLSRLAAPARCGGVVKADAYGIGASRVAPELYVAGCRDFFVAQLSEALALKPRLPHDGTIYVLNGLLPGAEDVCAGAGVVPVLNCLEQVEAWASACARAGHRLGAALQFDTGMSRLGLSSGEAEALASRPDLLRAFDLRLVMSHLACADERGHPSNASQLGRFWHLLRHFSGPRVSLANSGGVLLETDFHHDLVRPGVALYGVNPGSGKLLGLKPTVRLDARVIQVRDVPSGTAVGYGASFLAPRAMRIATLSVGYADGWSRHLSNKGAAFYAGVRLPIVGRISMDSTTVDVTSLPGDALALGSQVELIGPHQTIEDVAVQADTIPYEILTSLGRRYVRHYTGGVADAGRDEVEVLRCA